MQEVLEALLRGVFCRSISRLHSCRHFLDQGRSHLLRYHPIITLNGRFREIVVVKLYQTASATKTMPTKRTSAGLYAIRGKRRAQTLQAGRHDVHVGQGAEIAALDVVSRVFVDSTHRETAVVQREGRRQQREDPDLDGGIVQDGQFRTGPVAISVSELAPDCGVSDGYRHGTG